MDVVIDTNVFVSALQRRDGLNRHILELCFLDKLRPVMGDALYFEYEDLMGRSHLFSDSTFTDQERHDFFDDFCSICRWVDIYYQWRPNLRDEADNHIVELALSSAASTVLSWNKRDFRGGDLHFPEVKIITPLEYVQGLRTQQEA